jgi:hypothetical protein
MKTQATRAVGGLAGLILCFAGASVSAQTPDPATAHTTHAAGNAPAASTDTTKVQQEVARLRDQVRLLEQRMQAAAPAKVQQRGAMTMGNQGKGMMEMMRPKTRDDDMMGIGAMGGMKSPVAMATPSALPGFPGQSHLYHIGATGFFLDQPQHIALTTQQQQMLAQHKQQSVLRQADLQRQIDAAEEKLWQLTGADQPQIGNIDKQVREVERLRADQRIAFIRAVGETAKVLTDQQRRQLTGIAPAQSADPVPMSMPDSNQPKPDSMGHM